VGVMGVNREAYLESNIAPTLEAHNLNGLYRGAHDLNGL